MAIEETIYGMLSNDTAIRGQVGTRIYIGALPEGEERPSIVWVLDGPLPESMSRAGGVMNGALSLACWGATADNARTLARNARAVFQNAVPGTYYGTTLIGAVPVTQENDYSQPVDGGDKGLFVYAAKLTLYWEE